MRLITTFILFTLTITLPVFSASLKGTLLNGTTGKPGFAENVKIIRIGQGMQSIAEKKSVSGDFNFEGIQGEGPFLIQATYLGVHYNQIVPPGTQMKNHKVTVYEKSGNRNIISVKSLIQIVREKDIIRFHKLYVITNNGLPPRSYVPEISPEIYIPRNAEQVFGQLTQSSGMGIPLEMKPGIKGKTLDRAILPGTSELQVSYAIPAGNIADVETDDELLLNDGDVRHIFIKPQDMKISFASEKEAIELKEEIPEGLNAFKVSYHPGIPIKIFLSGGSPVITNKQRVITNGTFFDSWDRSILGLLAFMGVLFTLSFIFIYKDK